MRILIICSGNKGYISPFIEEQVESIRKLGNEVEILPIIGKGITGYLKAIPKLRNQARKYQPDIIHAHYGLAGLAASFIRKYPLVVTYHGSDVNIAWERRLSLISHVFSDYSIFVEESIERKLNKYFTKKHSIIPCGVDLDRFYPIDKMQVSSELGLSKDKTYCLFAGSFENERKNFNLANKSLEICDTKVQMIELANKSRHDVNLLLNAVDFLFLTSFSEGSPQIIKEAMGCNCPIVSTDVGDVQLITRDIPGILLCNSDPAEIKSTIENIIEFCTVQGRTNSRSKIIDLGLDSQSIALRVVNVYKKTLQIPEYKYFLY